MHHQDCQSNSPSSGKLLLEFIYRPFLCPEYHVGGTVLKLLVCSVPMRRNTLRMQKYFSLSRFVLMVGEEELHQLFCHEEDARREIIIKH